MKCVLLLALFLLPHCASHLGSNGGVAAPFQAAEGISGPRKWSNACSDRPYLAPRTAGGTDDEGRIMALESNVTHSLERVEEAGPPTPARESRYLAGRKMQSAGQKSAMALEGAELVAQPRKRESKVEGRAPSLAALPR